MKIAIANFVAMLALAGWAFAPTAHADGLADLVCPTLDQDPSAFGMHRMLKRFATINFYNQQAAWDTVTGAIHDQCPQHEPLIQTYLAIYGARI
jgi:hypothetical protein